MLRQILMNFERTFPKKKRNNIGTHGSCFFLRSGSRLRWNISKNLFLIVRCKRSFGACAKDNCGAREVFFGARRDFWVTRSSRSLHLHFYSCLITHLISQSFTQQSSQLSLLRDFLCAATLLLILKFFPKEMWRQCLCKVERNAESMKVFCAKNSLWVSEISPTVASCLMTVFQH